MRDWLRSALNAGYERVLRREVDGAPAHVAVIQDGNRRYARQRGEDATQGYQSGAQTTEQVLDWCAELGVEELTLYAFSTENFERPEEQQQHLFDLLEEKLTEFADADRVHDQRVRIRAIGDTDRLPERVQDAVEYAESRTAGYDGFALNVALAYGGRAELLGAARGVAEAVADGDLAPGDVDLEDIESRLHTSPVQDVDLIIRTGGDERTSNFLPWHANGSEAAVFFCTPYWPEFSKVDFLRAVRTYESREASWRRTRAERALALVRALGTEVSEARRVLDRFKSTLPEPPEDVEAEGQSAD
ncbi:tritrans,polycis-undecaprenyl-diphosphate synthase (geranylgeranyl-diphosphate specific) [Halobacterium hubeiense]|uniref:Tritrans,polycis-undecaprenyl-diphosphate synthase (geranylgeranyl-diphosphate specific) n=1 Tax=Halobacterium hubeiense TaxID=1407499 RepID=A0A0U5CZU7_9EURY|nr:polyprenyl diphosphate synthase [Halobacterium hubeiense]CQH59855.1 tritrans,polycis-undecaprenyl-diphosphate synthase (geranylgeranyl-diphosphate specific) [Halobacterium hubeiense]